MAPEHAGGVSLRIRIQQLLRVDGRAKPEIYAQLFDSASLTNLNYWLEIFFAAGIATLGLVLNSPAVIIGAMLISPLMGPIMATGLALGMGDLYLGIKAALNLVVSVAVSVALAALIVWALPFHSPTAEILARTNPNLLDLAVALLSGLAGSVVVCRGGGGGGVTALPGVAVAVALMPPLCAMGFGIGGGMDPLIIGGAGLLFLTNLVAIVCSAFLIFYLIRMDETETRAEIDSLRARRGEPDRLYRLLRHTAFSRALADGGRLHWRILMLAVLLGALYVPLRNGLEQVKSDVVARSAVQAAVNQLAPAGATVSHAETIGPDAIDISLVSTRKVDPKRMEETKLTLARRTGRSIRISVQVVASLDDVRRLAERMATPQPAPQPVPVAPPTLEELRVKVMEAIEPALATVWPSDGSMPLAEYDVLFHPKGLTVRVVYQAERDLQPEAIAVLQDVLRAELKAADLVLEMQRQRPPRNRKR